MRALAMRFRGLLRGNNVVKLDDWIRDARNSGVYAMERLARVLQHDVDAVRNAITVRWSNGQTEGQINRVKTLKRCMAALASICCARMLPFHPMTGHQL